MISLKRLSVFSFAILLTAICAAPYVSAQQPPLQIKPLRPSQKASVMQTIGVTDITITYSRPPVKGRTIFADAPATMAARAKGEATLDNQNERQKGEPIVPYGHVWRAGANEATMFVVTDDVLINGQPLKAGTYSMHTVPGKDEWTIIFNNDAGQWGSFTYDEKKDALRVKTKPQMASDNQEWLTYSFDPVTDNSATGQSSLGENSRSVYRRSKRRQGGLARQGRCADRRQSDQRSAATPGGQHLRRRQELG